ncbi:sulfotransferase 1C2A [Caerostris extrusa]|uniref:Sulfotransferase 1C2A n=1 Tax=Caerostris extrusa TaxID=172846 RepID=A0AAV4V082_CAEEX|nr:sulfotransferase 1C2A [Caerostris extrusa]
MVPKADVNGHPPFQSHPKIKLIKKFNMANVMKRRRYSKMNGLIYPAMYSLKCFQEALEYKPKPGDVFLDTYPKCGTTWMQNVAMYIFRKGKEMEKSTDF